MRTIVTGSVRLPVGGAEVSCSGRLDYDVLDISPCQKRTNEKEKHKNYETNCKKLEYKVQVQGLHLTTDKEPSERICDRKTPRYTRAEIFKQPVCKSFQFIIIRLQRVNR